MVETIAVTVENFNRAETDSYMSTFVKQGAFGKFFHNREPAPIDNQTVIRMNRDTLYSVVILDLDAGPAAVTLPNAGKRFISMQVISQDHFTFGVFYEPGTYTLRKDAVGTRYATVLVRTLANAEDPADLLEVQKVQDQIGVAQANSGSFEVPNWDQASQKKVRDALLVLATTVSDFERAFGSKEEVDPIRFLLATAAGWGGNPDSAAKYINVVPQNNNGTQVYRLHVKEVPVDGFWSLSVYNAGGYFEPNALKTYSTNNLVATPNEDGSITVQFGGCSDDAPNCIPIVPGWNYLVRLYRPRAEVSSGEWTFPEPEPVG